MPLPLDTSLSRPWSDSITTYAEAINETLRASGYWDMKYAQHQSVPEVIHPVDRCWCDFASGTFFEPFNTTEWEVLSVNRVKEGMMRRAKYAEDLEKKKEVKEEGMELEEPTDMPRTVSPYTPSPSASTWGRATNATSISIGGIRSSLWKAFESWKFAPRNAQSDEQVRTVSQNTSNHACQSLLRKEYDLRPYGVGIVVDFSWSRNT
ncbi:hypothetical protein VNI00_014380 [Paramarasmius palmivorus]|uniref:Uncharacterized protein n=1 Tax=Paramarasmius palmivorus TaxID=297713 RepID=A0AAW0BS70_9AGAR